MRKTMRLSPVVLSVLLSASSLLSCGSPSAQCQPTGITCSTDAGLAADAGAVPLTVQSCCTASQCNYVVSAAADAGVATRTYSCNGTDCQSAQNRVWNYCGQQCQATDISCALTGTIVQSCCTSQCKLSVVAAPDAGVPPKDFPCGGTNCQSVVNSVWDYCGQNCQTTGTCAKTADSLQQCCRGRCDVASSTCANECSVVVGAGDAGLASTSYPCNGTNCQAAQQSAADYCTTP